MKQLLVEDSDFEEWNKISISIYSICEEKWNKHIFLQLVKWNVFLWVCFTVLHYIAEFLVSVQHICMSIKNNYHD